MFEDDWSSSQLAASAFRAFRAALAGMGVDCPMVFDGAVWEQVVEPVLAIDDGSVVVAELGEKLRLAYHLAAALPADEQVQPEPRLSVAWQAVGCHLFACLQGMDENTRNLEASWAQWAAQRLPPPTPQQE